MMIVKSFELVQNKQIVFVGFYIVQLQVMTAMSEMVLIQLFHCFIISNLYNILVSTMRYGICMSLQAVINILLMIMKQSISIKIKSIIAHVTAPQMVVMLETLLQIVCFTISNGVDRVNICSNQNNCFQNTQHTCFNKR